jgi:hypothetical protein
MRTSGTIFDCTMLVTAICDVQSSCSSNTCAHLTHYRHIDRCLPVDASIGEGSSVTHSIHLDSDEHEVAKTESLIHFTGKSGNGIPAHNTDVLLLCCVNGWPARLVCHPLDTPSTVSCHMAATHTHPHSIPLPSHATSFKVLYFYYFVCTPMQTNRR